MNKIVVNFNFPHLTVEQYNNILTETEPLRKAAIRAVIHVAAPNGKGCLYAISGKVKHTLMLLVQ